MSEVRHMAWTFVSLHAMKPARSRGRRRWDARNLISTQVSPELSPVAVEANAQKLVTLLAVLGCVEINQCVGCTR